MPKEQAPGSEVAQSVPSQDEPATVTPETKVVAQPEVPAAEAVPAVEAKQKDKPEVKEGVAFVSLGVKYEYLMFGIGMKNYDGLARYADHYNFMIGVGF